jgi:hypothetical protein
MLFVVIASALASAQGGPPLLTDDPGTPGDRHWEINLGITSEVRRDLRDFELPIADFNYGWGDHTQLKFEIPWLLRSTGGDIQSELGDGKCGIKWRFVDQQKHGISVSTYPQFSWNSPGPQRLEDHGNQLLLPFEVSRIIGKLELNGEVGYNVKQHGVDELLFGFATGYLASPRLELLAEVHSTRLRDSSANESVFQFGGRQTLSDRYVLLFAAGSRLPGSSDREPQFIGYFGLQLRLGHARSKPD